MWILIIWMYGVNPATAEFSSFAKCQAAGNNVVEQAIVATSYICVEK